MKNLKLRKVFFFLLVISSGLIVTACGGNGGGSGSGDDSDVVVIEYWHVNSDAFGGAAVEWIIDAFNEEYAGQFEVVGRFNADMYGGLMSNLQAEVAAGRHPAVVQVGWALMDHFEANFNYTTPEELIERFGTEEDQDFLERMFLPNVLELAETRGGTQLGLPWAISTPVLFINQDILREAGLPEEGPETWHEVAEFARQIRDETSAFGIYIQEPADSWATQALMESNGARIIEDAGDGNIQATFASPEGIEAYQLYADLVADGSALHISWDEGVNAFVAGEIGMLYTTIARRAVIQEGADFDVTATPSPTWPGNERRIPAGGAMHGVLAQTDEQLEAAWAFLRFVYSYEAVAEWVMGTGFMPSIVGVAESDYLSGFLAENEMMQASLNQMDATVNWVSFPGDNGLRIEQMLLDMRDRILGGHQEVEEALRETQDAINAILD